VETLERDKPRAALQGQPADGQHCKAFALRVFARADERDRAGQCNADTAQAFAASALFFELLKDFDQLDEAAAAKQRYASWRSADLAASLRGGEPVPASPAPPEAPGSPFSPAPSWRSAADEAETLDAFIVETDISH
jgi:hypothetical protein